MAPRTRGPVRLLPIPPPTPCTGKQSGRRNSLPERYFVQFMGNLEVLRVLDEDGDGDVCGFQVVPPRDAVIPLPDEFLPHRGDVDDIQGVAPLIGGVVANLGHLKPPAHVSLRGHIPVLDAQLVQERQQTGCDGLLITYLERVLCLYLPLVNLARIRTFVGIPVGSALIRGGEDGEPALAPSELTAEVVGGLENPIYVLAGFHRSILLCIALF